MNREQSPVQKEERHYYLEVGVGVATGTAAAIAYYGLEYLPVNENIHADREEVARKESEANALIFTRDHLAEQDMLSFGQDYYLTETAALMQTEAQAIREETPNQQTEQLKVASVWLGVGALAFMGCALGRNILHKIRDRKSAKEYDNNLEAMRLYQNMLHGNRDDDDYTPPPAA